MINKTINKCGVKRVGKSPKRGRFVKKQMALLPETVKNLVIIEVISILEISPKPHFMKHIFLPLLIVVFTSFTMPGDCPDIGDAKAPKMQALNKLKNREVASPHGSIDHSVTITEMLNSSDDQQKFDETKMAVIEGLLFGAKQEKGESCNCHSSDVLDDDIHIYIAKDDQAETIADCVVIEVSGKAKAAHPEWNLAFFKALKNHKVKITGYLMYDFEHTNMSFESNPDADPSTIHRHTVWELHPITAVADEGK